MRYEGVVAAILGQHPCLHLLAAVVARGVKSIQSPQRFVNMKTSCVNFNDSCKEMISVYRRTWIALHSVRILTQPVENTESVNGTALVWRPTLNGQSSEHAINSFIYFEIFYCISCSVL